MGLPLGWDHRLRVEFIKSVSSARQLEKPLGFFQFPSTRAETYSSIHFDFFLSSLSSQQHGGGLIWLKIAICEICNRAELSGVAG